MALCAGGVLGLLYAGLLLAGGPPMPGAALLVVVLSAGWAVFRILNSRSLAVTLSLRDSGLWEVALSGTKKTMCLTHAWPAFAWLTLQFRDVNSSGRQKPLELVIWKSSVSSQAWCELWAHVAGQAGLPGRIPQKEGQ